MNVLIYDQKLIVFTKCRWEDFSVLQSSIHNVWSRRPGSLSLRTDPTYTVEYCSDTLPWPEMAGDVALSECGRRYYDLRCRALLSRKQGLTELYNSFHDSDETSSEIRTLRQLHVDMDNAVAAAYGWSDLDLDHGFHETKQGVRYTISEPARRGVLDRLLKLNHERFAEEGKQGLHEKKKPKATKGKIKADVADTGSKLFGEDD